MTGSPPLSRVSLAVAALDIGRVLADRDGVTFRAQGTCMYPAVRAGDVLRIRSCPADEVAVGDIAVCRTPDYLFGHRVVATGVSDGRAYVITRPDRSIQGEDAPTYDEDLLGVVVDIRRRGSSVPLEPKAAPRLQHWYHRTRLALIETAVSGRRRLVGKAARIQDQPAYRSLASRRFARLRPACASLCACRSYRRWGRPSTASSRSAISSPSRLGTAGRSSAGPSPLTWTPRANPRPG